MYKQLRIREVSERKGEKEQVSPAGGVSGTTSARQRTSVQVLSCLVLLVFLAVVLSLVLSVGVLLCFVCVVVSGCKYAEHKYAEHKIC